MSLKQTKNSSSSGGVNLFKAQSEGIKHLVFTVVRGN